MEKVIITNINGESITLGNQAPYYLQIIDGVGNIPVTIESQKAPNQDGSIYIDNNLEGRGQALTGGWFTSGSKI